MSECLIEAEDLFREIRVASRVSTDALMGYITTIAAALYQERMKVEQESPCCYAGCSNPTFGRELCEEHWRDHNGRIYLQS